MTFNDMLAKFQRVLNRDDCTTALAQDFLISGIARVQREAKLPCMERTLVIPTLDYTTFIAVPADLLEIRDVLVPDPWDGRPKALRKLSYRQLVRIDPLDVPSAYAREQSQIYIAGRVAPATNIQLLYYGTFSDFANGDSENEISASNPDLCIYGALSFAADNFEHPSADRWEQRYQQLLGQALQMANDLEMNGGPMEVQPLYGDY